MKRTIISPSGFLAGLLLAAPLAAHAAPETAKVRVCAPGELPQYYDADEGQVTAHRRFDLPVITYPFTAKPRAPDTLGLALELLIDTTGHVACYTRPNATDTEPAAPLTAEQQPVIDSLGSWTYAPFTDAKGAPITAYIREDVYEEERYRTIVPLPDGPAESFSVTLERSNCFGPCPAYSVTVKGPKNGKAKVLFWGSQNSDVMGKYSYSIDPEAVTALIGAAKQTNIWSARNRYVAKVYDDATYKMTLSIGGKTKTITDYGGTRIGMPSAVSRFMDAVDTAAGTADYIHLTPEGIARLQGEGFDVTSQAGADLLADANADPDTADNAVLRLIQAGAPLRGGHRSEGYGLRTTEDAALLPDAIYRGRTAVVTALVDKGVLARDGKPDQAAIDAAFDAAIGDGHMTMVQTFWAYHPSLTFADMSSGDAKTVPVTLLLHNILARKTDWEGLAIAQFLLAQGCDINAQGGDGTTLLHLAVKASDVAFVRYLLDHGARVTLADDKGETPLDASTDNDISILLLEAGADPSHKPELGYTFAEHAQVNGDKVLLAWLKAHGFMAPLPNPKGGY